MIKRALSENLKNDLGKGKAIILMGARQVGKTTLLRELCEGLYSETLWLNGDDADTRSLFENPSSTQLGAIIGNKKIVVIDEAQRISDIGIKLKLITDNAQGVQILATGSSSFDLANKINEPLTGRKWEHQLYPLSYSEMANHNGLLAEKRLLGQRLVYGYYPEVVNSPGSEKRILQEISQDYLYKDILSLDKIKKSDKIVKLLQALAFQIGSQVSYNELSQLCGISSATVETYIDILEQCYVIFRLGSFSRNLRNELKNSRKIYFYDNGIRNSLISNYLPINLRDDAGALWENFVISERQKFNTYGGKFCNSWFWRTAQQQEIDYIEEADGHMSAYEFKFNPHRKARAPLGFTKSYPEATFQIITPENIDDFLL